MVQVTTRVGLYILKLVIVEVVQARVVQIEVTTLRQDRFNCHVVTL